MLVADAKDGKQSVDDVLAAANALLDSMSAGTTPLSMLQASIDELEQMGYVCDESGCVLVDPHDADSMSGPPPINRLLAGSDWSLGMLVPDSDGEDEGAAGPLGAIVSGPCWSVPLKPSELADVMSMLSQLRLMVANLAAQGQWHAASAERPASRVKWETNAIVLQASHAAAAPGFSVSMTFRSDRRSIMTQWPAEVVAAVIAAVDEEAGGPPPGVAAASAQVAAPARSAPAAVSA